jgi:hypothetical protein
MSRLKFPLAGKADQTAPKTDTEVHMSFGHFVLHCILSLTAIKTKTETASQTVAGTGSHANVTPANVAIVMALPLPGSPSSSWALFGERLKHTFSGASPRVCIAFWLFGKWHLALSVPAFECVVLPPVSWRSMLIVRRTDQ